MPTPWYTIETHLIGARYEVSFWVVPGQNKEGVFDEKLCESGATLTLGGGAVLEIPTVVTTSPIEVFLRWARIVPLPYAFGLLRASIATLLQDTRVSSAALYYYGGLLENDHLGKEPIMTLRRKGTDKDEIAPNVKIPEAHPTYEDENLKAHRKYTLFVSLSVLTACNTGGSSEVRAELRDMGGISVEWGN